jgi:diaminohydroxyphosphoribosylaminopyrimidine deaminase / 5-amino-6-(5-phosphoribosylamino)uracil reductase
MNDHQERYMHRCLQLAKLGEGHTAPNPMVGCVIVNNGRIIGEGFHQRYGGPHAEVHAIHSVKDSRLLENSTLYVNLEPCSHIGKTPPCTDLIIENKIPNVIIGTVDPNPVVAGNGIRKLKEAGCNVTSDVLVKECENLNRRFFTFHTKKRPFIILKWAQSADGFVDSNRDKSEIGKPTWITDEIARVAVHKQRSTEGAIFIGTETALKDNPALTLRDWYGEQPVRIVTDLNNRLPSDLLFFDGKVKTIVLSNGCKEFRDRSILIQVQNSNVIKTLLDYLHSEKITSLVIEGGPKTLQNFLDLNLWDEAYVYIGDVRFINGIKAPNFNLSAPVFIEKFPQSRLSIFRNNPV